MQWFRSVEDSEAEERGQHFSASARERTRGNGSAEQHVELKISTKHCQPSVLLCPGTPRVGIDSSLKKKKSISNSLV